MHARILGSHHVHNVKRMRLFTYYLCQALYATKIPKMHAQFLLLTFPDRK